MSNRRKHKDDESLPRASTFESGLRTRAETREASSVAASENNEALLRSQKMEIIGTFASGIAHDFGNVLQGMIGCADLALNCLDAEHPASRFIQELRSAAGSGANIVNQLLQVVCEQETGERVVDLNRVIASRDTLLARLMGEDIQVRIRLGPSLAPVRCDASQLEQVLLNLAVNARHAMPSGGSLEIETREITLDPDAIAEHPGLRPGVYVAMTVKDTGEGMDRETVARAFEPFFTTKGPQHGTGLGLSTVEKIVHKCQGYVHVESERGKGSAFTVFLPRDGGPVSADFEKAVGGQRGNEVILLVEDEPLVRLTVRHYLERHGYRALPASGIQQAESLLKAYSERIDLLLTDVVLRDGSCARLETATRAVHPKMRVLYMSALPREALRVESNLDPGVALLRKPFSEAELLMRVRESLRDSWLPRADVGDGAEPPTESDPVIPPLPPLPKAR